MCRLTNLMILKLKKNQMRELDAWAGGLRSLMELDICDNEIDFVSPLLGQCTALQALRLNANRLRTLPPEVGSLEHLQLLHLHHNPLPLLLPEVRGLHSLQTLMLCNCQISGPLVHDFTSMVGLKHVDISGNAITALPENFGNLTRLKELHASKPTPCFESTSSIGHRAN
jgi:Leucine-rich repeat (LRR) protein